MKKCCICNELKIESEFGIDKRHKDGLISTCRSCTNKKARESYSKYKDKRSQRRKIYYLENKSIINEKHRKYFNENKFKIHEKHKLYYQKNKSKKLLYEKNKTKTNINYKLTRLLRSRILVALKTSTKSNSTLNLLGCSIEQLKQHLQQTAINNGYLDFDINSYSTKEYHIDHIVPCDSFNLPCSYHQKLCFHYSNLQILTSIENIKKGNRL